MMASLNRPVLVAITAVLSCSTVQASIEIRDSGFGPGTITFDTDTGLEWLDWTESTGISINSMIAQVGVGGAYEGWRHATRDEVRTLFNNIGLATTDWPAITHTYDGGASGALALSYLSETGGSTVAYGITADYASVASGARYYAEAGSTTGSWSNASQIFAAASELSAVGHALVRQSAPVVPEASSICCWLGLGLIGARWRRRQHR